MLVTLGRDSAWRPRRVDAELDPGGRGKGLVGKGSGKVRATLAWVTIVHQKSL